MANPKSKVDMVKPWTNRGQNMDFFGFKLNWTWNEQRFIKMVWAQGRAYVRASSGTCCCFILKLSCHNINIFVGLRELGNSLHRGDVASFQLGCGMALFFLGLL
jgi:hypothetical protein